MSEFVAAAIICVPVGIAIGWYFRGAAEEGKQA